MTFGSETGLHCLPAYAVTIDEMHSGSALRGSAHVKSVSFWIKSSARRAFGGCLGSKRR